MDRRQFVKLTGVGASGALAGNAAGQEQSTVAPANNSFEFTAVSDTVRVAINTNSPADQTEGITLPDVTPPLKIEGSASGGTWTSSPTTVTGQEIIDAFKDFNSKVDPDLRKIVEDALDTTVEDIVATALEELSVETLLTNSNGDELFKIIADVIDALDLAAGKGAELIDALWDGVGFVPDNILGNDIPTLTEIINKDPAFDSGFLNPFPSIPGLGLGSGAADKLLAGNVSRTERANLLQGALEGIDEVIDGLPSQLLDTLGFSLPEIPPLNDATDLVELGGWLLETLTNVRNSGLLGSQSVDTAAAVNSLESKVSDNPDREELEQAMADVQAEQQTASTEETVSTQQQDTTTIVDRLLKNNSISALDSELNTIATELRNQGFDSVLTGITIPSQQDLLSELLTLLENQLTLTVNIGEISGTYDHSNGTMTVPLDPTSNAFSVDSSFQNGIIQFVQDFIDQVTESSGGGGGGSSGIINEIINAIDPNDVQSLLDEFRAEIEKQDLFANVPTPTLTLTTATSGSLAGEFAVEDGPAGGQVAFVENEFDVGYDELVTAIGNIDVPTVLNNVTIDSVGLKNDLIDPIPDSTWDNVTDALDTQLQNLAQSNDPGFNRSGVTPTGFITGRLSGVSDFSTFLDNTVTSAASNITPENLLADVATNVDTATVINLVTTVAPQAFTDSPGRHAIEAGFTLVGEPDPTQLPSGTNPDDSDGDGKFENVADNNTSDVNIVDTQALFNAVQDGSAQQTPRAFNFASAGPDDEVSILDVAAHWRKYVNTQ